VVCGVCTLMAIYASRRLAKALEAAGLVPPNCLNVEILIPPNGHTTLRYTVFVDERDLSKLAAAIVAGAAPEEP
jgi:hypothetical protein